MRKGRVTGRRNQKRPAFLTERSERLLVVQGQARHGLPGKAAEAAWSAPGCGISRMQAKVFGTRNAVKRGLLPAYVAAAPGPRKKTP
jgi:hypothetical protein